jgi:hypothetical protein
VIPGSASPFFLGSSLAVGGGGAGYQVERSLRFSSSDSAYLSRTPAVAGNRTTWTWAGWVKRSAISSAATQIIFDAFSGTGSNYFLFQIKSSDVIQIFFGPSIGELITTPVYRDASAWYHMVLAYDTTQATPANRVRLYVNNVEVNTFSTATYPSQNNANNYVNSTVPHHIGAGYTTPVTEFFSGYLADVHFIDGQALTPSSFTEVSATTGQLIPLAYTGTYGTNGFQLKFADNSAATAATLGADTSGNGNNWTPNNLSVTAGAGNDSLVDTPTSIPATDTGVGGSVRGNYCTLNPLDQVGVTLTNGNLDATIGAGASSYITGTLGVSSGKYYFEFTKTANSSGNGLIMIGVSALDKSSRTPGWGTYGWAYCGNGLKYSNSLSDSYGTVYTSGDVIGCALDMDNGKVWWSKNGVFQNSGDPAVGTNAAYTNLSGYVIAPSTADASGNSGNAVAFNAGQRAFAYTAPSGFKALCDTNLGAPLVAKPNTLMDVKLWTGTGATQSITGVGFNPDFLWIKSRSGSGYNHHVYDSVRGIDKFLRTNTTQSEFTVSPLDQVTSLNADGFTLGSDSASPGALEVNELNQTYVGWLWDAGTSTDPSNTAGSITSQVRANASAGFSVVTFTKTGGSSTSVTVGHGLGAEPHMIIVKNRNTADDWYVYTKMLGNTKRIQLNSTSAEVTGTNLWGSTTPTSTVFTVRALFDDAHVAYCFAPVVGYSNGFSYTGNGSADGSFVYLGFRPRLIMLKRSDSTSNWTLLDTSREGYNVDNDPLYPNLSDAEGTTDLLDITSNGFKLRSTDASVNASAGTYIGFAWAEAPFAYSRAR